MKILVICDMYPSKKNPIAGIFIKEQIEQLRKFHEVFIIVIGRKFKRINIRTIVNFIFNEVMFKMVIFLFKHIFLNGRVGVDANIINGEANKNYTDDVLSVYYKVFIFGNKPLYFFNRISAFIYTLMALKRIQFTPEIIHAHKSFPAGYVGWKLQRRFRIPVVVTEHQSPFSSYFSSPYTGSAVLDTIRNVDKTICVSNFQRDIIVKYGIHQDKLVVIYNGIDINKFSPDINKIIYRRKEIEEERIKLLLVGTLEARKGITYLVKAIRILKKEFPFIHLSLVGPTGGEARDLFDIIRELKLENTISYLGAIPNDKLADIINEHDILVSSSLDETFGVNIVEAMACGKPVVVTRSGGPEEFIVEKVGILVPKKNAMFLGEGIKSLIKNYLNNYDPNQIRSYVTANFSQDLITHKINELYKDLTNKT